MKRGFGVHHPFYRVAKSPGCSERDEVTGDNHARVANRAVITGIGNPIHDGDMSTFA